MHKLIIPCLPNFCSSWTSADKGRKITLTEEDHLKFQKQGSKVKIETVHGCCREQVGGLGTTPRPKRLGLRLQDHVQIHLLLEKIGYLVHLEIRLAVHIV